MGQAKLRGTKEQRIKEGIAKEELLEKEREERYQQHLKNNPSTKRSRQLLARMLGIIASSKL